MRNSIFGWSYPPGCSSVPGDEPAICQLCGLDAEESKENGGCTCPECSECGEHGCIDHVSTKDLDALQQRYAMLAFNFLDELKKRYKKNPTICSVCKHPLSFYESTSQDGMPYHNACACEIILQSSEERIY